MENYALIVGDKVQNTNELITQNKKSVARQATYQNYFPFFFIEF